MEPFQWSKIPQKISPLPLPSTLYLKSSTLAGVFPPVVDWSPALHHRAGHDLLVGHDHLHQIVGYFKNQ